MEGEFLSERGAVATGLVCVLAPTARNAIAWAIGPGRVAVKGTKALKARNRLSFALPSQDLNPQSPIPRLQRWN